jgi:hypothetical protein
MIFKDCRRSVRQKNNLIIHNISKIDQLNLDIEDDECNYIWDLDRDWTKKYFRRNNIVLTENAPIAVDEIGNHRKQYLHEGEFLIVWKHGIRDWTPMSIAYDIDPKMKKLITNYLLKNNLTKNIIEKCLIPATIDEIEETKEFVTTSDNVEPTEAKKSDDGKLPNEPNSLPDCELLTQIGFISQLNQFKRTI